MTKWIQGIYRPIYILAIEIQITVWIDLVGSRRVLKGRGRTTLELPCWVWYIYSSSGEKISISDFKIRVSISYRSVSISWINLLFAKSQKLKSEVPFPPSSEFCLADPTHIPIPETTKSKMNFSSPGWWLHQGNTPEHIRVSSRSGSIKETLWIVRG